MNRRVTWAVVLALCLSAAHTAGATGPQLLVLHDAPTFCNCSGTAGACSDFDNEITGTPSKTTGVVRPYVHGLERVREVRFGLERDPTLSQFSCCGGACADPFTVEASEPPPFPDVVGYIATSNDCNVSRAGFHHLFCNTYELNGTGAVRVVPHPDTGKVEVVDCDGFVHEVPPENWAVAGFGVESYNPCVVKPVPLGERTWSGIKASFR